MAAESGGDTHRRARQAGPAPTNYTSQQEWAAGRGLEEPRGHDRKTAFCAVGSPSPSGGAPAMEEEVSPRKPAPRPCTHCSAVGSPAPAHLGEPEPRPAPQRGWAAGEGVVVGLGPVAWEGLWGRLPDLSSVAWRELPFLQGGAAPTLKQD